MNVASAFSRLGHSKMRENLLTIVSKRKAYINTTKVLGKLE